MKYAAMTLAVTSCMSVEDVKIAPIPCVTYHFPIKPIDLNPSAPENGVCLRAKIKEEL